MSVRILAVGDICGKSGLDFLQKHLRGLQQWKGADFTVVDGENASVVGLTPAQAELIFAAGADVVTLGNHTWSRAEIKPYLDEKERIIRPANFAPMCPGQGWAEVETDFGLVRVISLIGRFGMDPNVDNPFTVADDILRRGEAINLVEFHAEGTSEKGALGYYLDGRVSAVWGTHTHVQTSDAMVLPGGTGFITDLGMTGPVYSVLG
ncbi:MAG: YmdB family metallophosphoesterase, partial [Defluviitaleaceae bacterium]|nr:YmdB family metallophosphoesterase [Defluviitaleaceae bacterium]